MRGTLGSVRKEIPIHQVDGTPAFKLKVAKENGDVDILYLDEEYFVEFKMEAEREVQGSEISVATVVGDYKEVDGLLFAHSMGMSFGGGEVRQVITIQKIELGVEFPEDHFAMPEKVEAAAAGKDRSFSEWLSIQGLKVGLSPPSAVDGHQTPRVAGPLDRLRDFRTRRFRPSHKAIDPSRLQNDLEFARAPGRVPSIVGVTRREQAVRRVALGHRLAPFRRFWRFAERRPFQFVVGTRIGPEKSHSRSRHTREINSAGKRSLDVTFRHPPRSQYRHDESLVNNNQIMRRKQWV